MNQIWSRLNPYLNWVICMGVLLFLAKALQNHWQEVVKVRIDGVGWICLGIALTLTLLAHTLAGWVWSLVLREFKQPVSSPWLIQVYLKTNIARYLPGNIWHYYGRISTVTSAGVPTPTATLSVVIEPLLMAAAALLFVLVGSPLCQGISQNVTIGGWQTLCLGGILTTLHPSLLNPILQGLGKWKESKTNSIAMDAVAFKIERYPLIPLIGGIGFIGLRSLGFLFIFLAINPVSFSQFPLLLTAFSIAWLTALIVPGVPGGIGVFETTAIALLSQPFSTGIVISVAALYRLISILAEATGAGLANLAEQNVKREFS